MTDKSKITLIILIINVFIKLKLYYNLFYILVTPLLFLNTKLLGFLFYYDIYIFKHFNTFFLNIHS